MDQRIENIIREKQFIELNEDELNLLQDWAKTEEEYDQLKMVFSSVDALNEESKEQLNPTIKQRLDVRFKEKYDHRRLVWYNKLWVFLWPEETGLVKKPLIQLAAVGLVVAIVTPFLFLNDPSSQQLAMKEESEIEQPKMNEEVQEKDEVNVRSKDHVKAEEERTSNTESVTRDNSVAPEEELNPQGTNDKIKDLEMSAPKDEMVDRMAKTDDLYMTDEVAESEPASSQQENISFDQAPAAEQQVYAGVTTESREKSLRSDADKVEIKKVDQDQTIGLLTALY